MKVKDLKFIDVGLPSGNKLCVDLLNNLYRVKDLNLLSYLLPTRDELKELLLFCSFEFTSIDVDIKENDETSDAETQTIKGLRIYGLNNSFFLPFLGVLSNDMLHGEYLQSEILTLDKDDDETHTAVRFTKDVVSFDDAHPNKNDFIQILLIKRNEGN